MLPKIYTLEAMPIVGYLSNVSPSIHCLQCNRQVTHYQELQLFLDVWPECDLVTDRTDDQLFISDRLLLKFESAGVGGYSCRRVALEFTDDFRLQYPEGTGALEVPKLCYLMIASQYDGPWQYHSKGASCSLCGQTRLVGESAVSYDEMQALALGDVSNIKPTLVFSEAWEGEDIFYHTEMRKVVITERVATILAETGNLRKEEIKNKDKVRRLMPKYAERLEKVGWLKPVCCVLGPADWVITH
jgi:hypothetical protein